MGFRVGIGCVMGRLGFRVFGGFVLFCGLMRMIILCLVWDFGEFIIGWMVILWVYLMVLVVIRASQLPFRQIRL